METLAYILAATTTSEMANGENANAHNAHGFTSNLGLQSQQNWSDSQSSQSHRSLSLTSNQAISPVAWSLF